ASLERSCRLTTLVLDKTGTITSGSPRIVDLQWALDLQSSPADVLRWVGSVERLSEHVLAQAVTEYARSEEAAWLPVESFAAIAGQGVQGRVNDQWVHIGTRLWMEQLQIATADFETQQIRWEEQGKTVIYLAVGHKVAGIAAASDTIKPTSAQAVRTLQSMGLEVAMLTGDNPRSAAAIAEQVGIKKVFAQVRPDQKAATIRAFQDQGQTVAMVGDGINDAPALAQADVGIAIGTGTDVAIAASDITLISGDLSVLPTAIALSQATLNNIRQNLLFAFVYNVASIPIAAGLFYPILGWLLSPVLAGAAMALSSVSVVSNALRLRNFNSVIG
ncbi:MAG: heavy metal translocating P-type ATPase, partial [Cyanobacteria bacterium P01_F01_bin.42]